MKKVCKSFIFIVILAIVCVINNVNAASYSIYKVGKESIGDGQGLNLYNGTIDGQAAMTYCLDAGLQYGGDGARGEMHEVDPEASCSTGSPWCEFDIGATFIYQHLKANGMLSLATDHRVSGSVAYRLLANSFAVSKGGNRGTPQLNTSYNYFNVANGVIVGGIKNSKDFRVLNGINIYYEAMNVVNNYRSQGWDKFKELGYGNGGVWTATFKSSEPMMTQNSDGSVNLTFTVTPEGEKPDDYTSYINNFSVKCSNQTVYCEFVGGPQSVDIASDGSLKITMKVVELDNYDGKDYGITTTIPYYDQRSTKFQIKLLSNGGYQKMLLISERSNPHTYTPDLPNVPVPTGGCCGGSGEYCQYKKDGKYYCKTNSGSTKECSDQSESKNLGCGQTCSYKNKKDNTYYCTDINKPGEIVKCENQDPSHNANCPDNGDTGKACTKEGDKCYCKDGKECDCVKEYPLKEQCGTISCTPNITLASSCNEFNYDANANGLVSDINEISSTCNPDVNQIKTCVLGSNDLAGNTLEDKSVLQTDYTGETDSNPYCSVWCTESYNFELPTATHTVSGGTFELSTKVSGKRVCYVGARDDKSTTSTDESVNGINYNKFVEDLKKASQELVEKYNIYNKEWNAARANETSTTHECNCDEDGKNCSTYTVYSASYTYDVYNASKESKTTESGSWSDGSCGSSGTSQIPGHVSARDAARKDVVTAANKLNQIIKNYNTCSGNSVSSENSVSSFATYSANTDTVWTNNFKFDPTVEFEYDDYYNEYLKQKESKKGQFERVNTGDVKVTTTDSYCSKVSWGSVGSDVGQEYQCSGDFSYTNLYVFSCDDDWIVKDENGVESTLKANHCERTLLTVPAATRIVKTASVSNEKYNSGVKFSTYTPYGTIATSKTTPGREDLYTSLKADELPISASKKTGVYNFKFSFYDIGQYYSSGNWIMGRLISNPKETKVNSVLNAYTKLSDDKKCSVYKGSEFIDTNHDGKVTVSNKGSYVCHFITDCDECTFKCDDRNETNCEICVDDECEPTCTDCIFTCKNCVIDGYNSTYKFRSVSLNNLFPNEGNGEVGFNWDNSIGSDGKPVNPKAYATLKEISNNAENAYEEATLSYTLTPNQIANIKRYNKENSFTNDTISGSNDNSLTCKKYFDLRSSNGDLPSSDYNYSVRCESEFLTMIHNKNGNYATENIDIQERRSGKGGYNDLFTGYVDQNGVYQKITSYTYGIGPSWK